MSRTFNKAWCMFEQSGTFKNEFIKLGIPAVDLDIQNNFNETDYVIDLFGEIEKEYAILQRERERENTIFSAISQDDIVMAFFPCIYFSGIQMMYYSLNDLNNMHKPKYEQVVDAIERTQVRTRFHILLYKLYYISLRIGFKLVIENPYSPMSYIIGLQNFPPPSLVDKNRQHRGDYFTKPTAYWFVNFEPSFGTSYQAPKEKKTVNDCKQGIKAGICSEERSLISPDYARNFICDFILGKEQENIGQGSFQFD